ncbi:hypothetical protein F4604DRAFT_1653097 [Suillus subluteus]|nr:hypothetical protein F4604DRAFT_1653097 [Suillus subluteus]
MTPRVSFPSTDSTNLPAVPITHLPFRRISLPSVPSSSLLSAQHRQSVASFASFDSLPEEPVVRRPKRRSLNRKHSRTPNTPADIAREAKRTKVIREFWDTERSYVQGLDLVHDHFLTPIIASLETPRPLLTRTELNTIFSNFIDIWNFHHAFFSALTALLYPSVSHLDVPHPPPSPNPAPLSALLLSHFPYLSLYTPFITAFPCSISFLARPPAPFAIFLRNQERDPRCGHLKLTDWLLSIVQRCPRYVLLLRELINVERREKEGEGEWDRLGKVLTLVEKGKSCLFVLTSSLNASLNAHAHTLALLSLQRATLGLPPTLHFVQPGRTLIFRTPLVIDSGGVAIEGPGIGRGRRDRICEFLLFDDILVWLDFEPSTLRDSHWFTLAADATASDERHTYTYKNHLSLVDIEAVLDPSHHPPRMEVLSPGGSFAVYAVPSQSPSPKRLSSSASESALTTRRITPLTSTSNDTTLHTFLHLLRQARSALLARDPSVALRGAPNVTTPNHVEGLPPSARPQRAPLPFLPPVWVPDAKTEACMRCARPFGFVRRRHHCRLCGRVVCADCSGRTFYITDPSSQSPSGKNTKAKPARACNECYEAAFPLVCSITGGSSTPSTLSANPSSHHTGPSPTLFGIPAWLSTPISTEGSSGAHALMAMTLSPSRDSQRQEIPPTLRAPISRPIRIRHSTRPRPRSYHDILDDFEVHARGGSMARREIHDGVQEEEDHDEIHPRQPCEREPIPRYAHEKREDTARKKKRFSLPAVAVQTVPVVARSAPAGNSHGRWGRRFSLVLGPRTRGRNGESGSEREGSMHSSLLSSRDDQNVRPPSRGDKVGKGGRESSAASALMDVLRGRRGKERA